jgi:lipopolysaccharide transport system ATP-binding protein
MIKASHLGKCYRVYKKPSDRIKQSLMRGRKTYAKEIWALRDVSFSLNEGEVVGVIGANGSGKSTLLQMLVGTLQPSEGDVAIEGRVAALLELGAGFNPEFTGHENLFINAALLGLSQKKIEEKYDDIVAFADIGEFLHQPLKTYSSGMYVRLAFAITVHVEADVLIIDEALAVGDASFQFKCLARMDELIKTGCTVLIVTHDTQMIKQYCTRAIYLDKGRQIFDGPVEEAVERYMQDVLETQRNQMGKVSHKTEGVQADALVYGTEFGKIISAEIFINDEAREHVYHNERISIRLKACVSDEVKCPRVMIVIRDRAGYNLFSYDNLYANEALVPDEKGEFAVEIQFQCLLQEDDYSITLRLDEHHGNRQFSLVEKQVNGLNFKVLHKQRIFDARVDLNGSCRQLN